MNYDDRSDFEINMAVMKIELRGQFIEYHEQEVNELLEVAGFDGKSPVVRFTTQLRRGQSFDGCNNPSDAWPIILSTGMDIELAHKDLGGIGTCTIYNPMGTDWQCDFDSNHKALRAAMICFLKMKESENG